MALTVRLAWGTLTWDGHVWVPSMPLAPPHVRVIAALTEYEQSTAPPGPPGIAAAAQALARVFSGKVEGELAPAADDPPGRVY